MKNRIAFACSLILCICQLSTSAQIIKKQRRIKKKLLLPLKIGDKVPDYTLKNVINYPTKTVNFNQFRGKLLILDFWNTDCGSCIAGFPKMEALQKEFDGQIQILLVDPGEDESSIAAVFSKQKEIRGLDVTLPTVCGDTSLWKLFKYKSVPREVWINKNGIIKYMTYPDVVNSNRIKAILNNENVVMHQANDNRLEFDVLKPFFINGNAGNGEGLISQTIFSKGIDGMPSTEGVFADAETGYSISSINSVVKDMYGYAYSHNYNMYGSLALTPQSQIMLLIQDSSRYVAQINGEYQDSNKYIYQYSGPPASVSQLQKKMQADLQQFFGLKGEWQKQTMKCLVLSAEDTSFVNYREGITELFINDINFKANKVTVGQILAYMQIVTDYFYSPYPLIDETGYKGKIGGISFSAKIADYLSLDKALEKYKMHFRLEDREAEVLVISPL